MRYKSKNTVVFNMSAGEVLKEVGLLIRENTVIQ